MLAARSLLVLIVLCFASCASQVRIYPRTENAYALDRTQLEAAINSSLAASGWQPDPSGPSKVFYKSGAGGQRTFATFLFYREGNASSFEMSVASGHVVNWMTFGIAGVASKGVAGRVAEEWLRRWQSAHPPLDAAEAARLRRTP